MAKQKKYSTVLFTFNDNFVCCETIKSLFRLDKKTNHQMLNKEFCSMQEALLQKGLNYKDFKKALIPPQKGYIECAFLFRMYEMENLYGAQALNPILKIISESQAFKKATFSIKAGDAEVSCPNNYIDTDLIQQVIEPRTPRKREPFSQYFIVYINSLTINQAEIIDRELNSYSWYAGYVDISKPSFSKNLLLLPQLCIKTRNTILLPRPYDADGNDSDLNTFYKFNKFNFDVKYILDIWFHSFLCSSIVSLAPFKEHADASFEILYDEPLDSSPSAVNVSLDKVDKYLKTTKVGILKNVGLSNSTPEEIAKVISSASNSGHIYNIDISRIDDPKDPIIKYDLRIWLRKNATLKSLIIACKYSLTTKECSLVTIA